MFQVVYNNNNDKGYLALLNLEGLKCVCGKNYKILLNYLKN